MNQRTAMARSAAMMIAIAMVAVAAISAAAIENQSLQTATDSTGTVLIVSSSSSGLSTSSQGLTTSTSTVHSAIELELGLNSYSQTVNGTLDIGLSVSLFNTRTTQLTLNPGQLSFGLGPCSQLPLGVQLYEGHYGRSNISGAIPLVLYQPGTYMCPAEFSVAGWSFAPMSDNVTLLSEQPAGAGNATTEESAWTQAAASNTVLPGYWGDGTMHPFPSGIYTAAADDEWGDLVIVNFYVS